jgi:enoyl-CoA hydratase
MNGVYVEADGPVLVVAIDRRERRNAVDPAAATALVEAFSAFDADSSRAVSVLTGAGGTFCAGADLKALADGGLQRWHGDGPPRGGGAAPQPPPVVGLSPMGPVRMRLGKPVVAAIEGHAVGGGLELALWCDLRVAAEDAVLGVFNRRFAVPLVDLGTVRLPRLIGHSRAMDLILTGRGVDGEEAHRMGLVNRLVAPGQALAAAIELAHQLATLPQTAMRNDRLSALEQWDLPEAEAIRNELRRGLATIASAETQTGIAAYTAGRGRHGAAP